MFISILFRNALNVESINGNSEKQVAEDIVKVVYKVCHATMPPTAPQIGICPRPGKMKT